MSSERILKCACGRSYRVYPMTTSAQHACPVCIERDRRAADATEREVEKMRRKPSTAPAA